MLHTLIVPGLDGSSAEHWQGDWAACDPHALMVDLSDPSAPVPAVWEIELASMILAHPNCILVGHSLGAILITRLLSKWPHLNVAGAILVAPADTEAGNARISHFGTVPQQPLPVPSIVVASRDDPWMKYERAIQLADVWGSDVIDQGKAGHINIASGYGPWRDAWRLRDKLRFSGGLAEVKPARKSGFRDLSLSRPLFGGHLNYQAGAVH